MHEFTKLKGILFDLDGVLYVGDQPINGAIEAIAKVRNSQSYADASSIRPTAVIGSIADLPALLDL